MKHIGCLFHKLQKIAYVHREIVSKCDCYQTLTDSFCNFGI
jgi:hypothetical protein